MKFIRMLFCAAAVCLQPAAHSKAQSLDWRSVSSAAGVATGPGGSLSATTGQAVTQYLTTGSGRLTQGFQQPELDLSLLPVLGPFCNGDTISIPYRMLGYFGNTSTLTAELSDASGSFASAITLASLTTSSGGSLSAVIPFSIAPGNAYRIRLRTSAPLRNSNTSANYTVNLCSLRLNLLALIEGYYIGAGMMTPTLFNTGLSTDPTATDSIQVELRSSTDPFSILQSIVTILHSNGSATCIFPASVYSGTYYVVLRHRNSVEVWSKNPVAFTSAISSYDFIH